MKTQAFRLIAIVTLLLTYSFAQSQDMILKKNNEIIKCKIKEIGLDEIKYILPDYPSDLTFSIDKDKITKIIFESGQEMEFKKQMTDPDSYADNKKNAIKLDFTSILFGYTAISYERNLKPGRAVEGTLGIIGLGLDNWDENPAGLNIKMGYKFARDPDFYLRGMRYAHILKGSYVKPEISLGLYGRDFTKHHYSNYPPYLYSFTKTRETVFSGAFQLVFGKQWVFDNAFLVDYSVGVGYGFTSISFSESFSFHHYGYTVAPSEFPISFSSGLRIGYLFK